MDDSRPSTDDMNLIESVALLWWPVFALVFTLFMVIDLFDCGLRKWLCQATTWLSVAFMFLLSSGALADEDLSWAAVAYVVMAALFTTRLYKCCKGSLTLAPFADNDVSRLKSVHFVWVNQKTVRFDCSVSLTMQNDKHSLMQFVR